MLLLSLSARSTKCIFQIGVCVPAIDSAGDVDIAETDYFPGCLKVPSRPRRRVLWFVPGNQTCSSLDDVPPLSPEAS